MENDASANPPRDYANGDPRKAGKTAEDWLPITSSRNAKWWYSAFHNVTAMVGAGVLSLPYAISYLGWGPGVAVLVLSWVITLYTLWQMVEMHEMVPGKRFDRYHELGQHAFGEKLGLWIVVPQQLIVEVGVDIVYMVTGGKSLKRFHDLVCKSPCKNIKLSYFIAIFGSVHFFLAQLPNFNSVAGVSLAAAVMSLSYSTIAWGASVHKGQVPDVDYGYRHASTAGTVFGVFNSLGDVAFAYAGHNVVLEIQATIPSTPEKPSKIPMWRGVVVAYIVVALCYFPVALAGYWAFGNKVDDDVLLSLEKPHWLIAAANMMVVVHVIGSYQIYAMPVFDMMETVLVKKFHLPPGMWLRLIARSTYVGEQNLSVLLKIEEKPLHMATCVSQNNEFEAFFSDISLLLLVNDSINLLYWYIISFLWGSAWVLWRLCFRSNNLFSSLHHVAGYIQAKKIQLILDNQLDMYCFGGYSHDCIIYWRFTKDHRGRIYIWILPINLKKTLIMPIIGIAI